jgi:hypothetical protein
MATLRNLAIGILHLRGWHNIVQRCAATPATPPESCHCLAPPAYEPRHSGTLPRPWGDLWSSSPQLPTSSKAIRMRIALR